MEVGVFTPFPQEKNNGTLRNATSVHNPYSNMKTDCKTPGAATTAPGNGVQMVQSIRNLQRDFSRHREPATTSQSDNERSGVLFHESRQLHDCLVNLGKFARDTNALERAEMKSALQTVFLPLLVETHMRLLALTNAVAMENGGAKKEIAQTHVCVRDSAILLNTLIP